MGTDVKLILASESPFRKQLMEQMGFDFKAVAPKIDEDQVRTTLNSAIEDWPLDLAKAKAASLTKDYKNSIIIGCDQTAFFQGKGLLKPKNKDEALKQLLALSGQTHRLRTALAVWKNKEWYTKVVDADMTMAEWSEESLKNYIERDTPVGCAGSYKIESLGPVLFKKIETSDYYSIIGLPLLALSDILTSLDYRVL